MDQACARPVIDSRITGGQSAAAGRWPWHVVFKRFGYLFCQGSLITDQWVLTAAQCSINSYLSGAEVQLGAINQTGFDPNLVTRRVEYFICHQDLTNRYENDICLVKLSAPVNFTDYIQPVCLAAENSTFYEGTTSWVTGFGYNIYWSQADTLQEVDVPIVGNNKCTCYFKSSYDYYSANTPTENQLCAGQEDGLKDAFYGDLGAALVTKKDFIWVQSGIVSQNFYWLHRPTIYTRVSQYQKWISDKVTGMQPGFITFISPGNDVDLNYTCPTSAPSTTFHFFTDYFRFNSTTPTSPNTPATTIDKSIWSSGVSQIPITHFIPLSVFVLFLHVFVGNSGI
ncbi:serine protease 27-like [Nematolebias whitei]|uniref:serine protease 27-like n=1 Tax=Nematolebias whitei TaxID=451745 RepID=UPI00189C47AE|nr:serine protease 27-like [Nematolebias whitei]